MFVRVNNTLYPATIDGLIHDRDWDDRESKAITLEGDFATVDALFPDGTAWDIVEDIEVPMLDSNGAQLVDEDGNPTYTTERHIYDNSDFCIRGDLTVHTNGTCTVKMGKPTDLENAYEILYGGN